MTSVTLLDYTPESGGSSCSISNISSSIPPTAKSNLLGVVKDGAKKGWEPCVLEGDSAPDLDGDERTPYGSMLPGHGHGGRDCGKSIVCVCSTCGHTWETESKCGQRECPSCWKAWTVHEGKTAAARMWILTNGLYAGRRYRRLLHVVVSFPYVKGSSYYSDRAKAYRIAEKRGISGGCIITHTHRAKEGEYLPDGYVHFHIVGVALGNVAVPQEGERLPYVFKVIRDAKYGDYKGVRTYKELSRLITYQLSHCAIKRGVHALSWFGFLSYNSTICGVKFNVDSRIREDYPSAVAYLEGLKQLSCPKCGSVDVARILPWEIEAFDSVDFHPNVTSYQKCHPS